MVLLSLLNTRPKTKIIQRRWKCVFDSLTMASEQVRRDNVNDKRNTEVEKDVVTKMRTHFESLAEKAKTPQGSPGSVGSVEKVHQYETLPVGVGAGETKVKEGKKWERGRREDVQREGEWRQGPSLEDISKLRATAQQNYMEAISDAEERYEKAKESGDSAEDEQRPRQGSGGGGVFQAIGETLMEIGQTTKDLLFGQYPIQVLEQEDRGPKDRGGEPYLELDKGFRSSSYLGSLLSDAFVLV